MEASIILNISKTIDLSNKSAQTKLNVKYIFGTVTCSIYLLCSIFSNILNLPLLINWIFKCKKDKYTDFLIISITVSDFLCGFLVCPIYSIQELIKMNYVSSYVISTNLFFVTESIDYSIWWISPLSLLLLSMHRFKQLISPFKEGAKLNRLRVLTIVSIWLIFPIISFPITWSKNLIKTEELVNSFNYIRDFIVMISVYILNILIVVQFKLKLKNTRLNKKNSTMKRRLFFVQLH